jgi:hypothetical protein
VQHAYDPDLEVELELIDDDLDVEWFSQPDDVIATIADVPTPRGLLAWLRRRFA